MTRQDITSDALARRVYRAVLRDTDWSPESIAGEARVSEAAVEEAIHLLEEVGLLTPSPTTPSGYAPVDPEAALSRLFSLEGRQLRRHQEEISQTRSAISTIMSDFLTLRSEQRDSVEIEALLTPAQINAFLDDVASLVKEEEWGMHVGGVPPVELIDDMLLRDKEVLQSGIAMRGVYLQRHLQDPFMAGYLHDLAAEGAQVRIATHLPLRMLLIDSSLALIPINPDDTSQGAFAIRGADLVRSLRAVFEHCWISASPLEPAEPELPSQQSAPELSPTEALVIRLLADGVKDDAVARRLGISARTLTRMIATLLERLGVQTRFQAALELSRRGWLDEWYAAAPCKTEPATTGLAPSATPSP